MGCGKRRDRIKREELHIEIGPPAVERDQQRPASRALACGALAADAAQLDAAGACDAGGDRGKAADPDEPRPDRERYALRGGEADPDPGKPARPDRGGDSVELQRR